jgi:uncharacterized membrane protein
VEEERAYADEASKRVGHKIAFRVLLWLSFVQGVIALVIGFLIVASSLYLGLFVFISALIALCSCTAWNAVEEMYEKLERLSSA